MFATVVENADVVLKTVVPDVELKLTTADELVRLLYAS